MPLGPHFDTWEVNCKAKHKMDSTDITLTNADIALECRVKKSKFEETKNATNTDKKVQTE